MSKMSDSLKIEQAINAFPNCTHVMRTSGYLSPRGVEFVYQAAKENENGQLVDNCGKVFDPTKWKICRRVIPFQPGERVYAQDGTELLFIGMHPEHPAAIVEGDTLYSVDPESLSTTPPYKFKKHDIVITREATSEHVATVLERTNLGGDPAYLLQFHYQNLPPCKVVAQFVRELEE